MEDDDFNAKKELLRKAIEEFENHERIDIIELCYGLLVRHQKE